MLRPRPVEPLAGKHCEAGPLSPFRLQNNPIIQTIFQPVLGCQHTPGGEADCQKLFRTLSTSADGNL